MRTSEHHPISSTGDEESSGHKRNCTKYLMLATLSIANTDNTGRDVKKRMTNEDERGKDFDLLPSNETSGGKIIFKLSTHLPFIRINEQMHDTFTEKRTCSCASETNPV